MTSQRPLGIGVIGTGGWARTFWRSAKECSDVRLVACWNRTPERAAKFAEQFGGEVMPTLDALLSHPEVDAVANFAANSFHRGPTEAAAGAGKHVFVDKPIANSVADSLAMIRACEDANVTLMVGHSSRYSGTARTLKRLLDEGKLGQLAMAEGNNSHSGGTRLDEGKWRWHRAEAPGGPLMQLSIHTVDTMHYLFGPIHRVTAFSNSSLLPTEIEDVFLALLEFESGLLAYVGTNYLSPGANFLRIYGREASAYVEENKISLARVKPDEPWITEMEVVPVEEMNPQAAEMSEFARAVRTGTPPETDGKGGLLALGVVWACLMSAEQGRPVEVREALAGASSAVG
ncbi:MAG: Gfo/Idh/MocA family oxidoreductase [Armatimonadetes bacterium]|nr:Gfo/Idh/MocA family oxidoreductase [Armatimonadota bacterium]